MRAALAHLRWIRMLIRTVMLIRMIIIVRVIIMIILIIEMTIKIKTIIRRQLVFHPLAAISERKQKPTEGGHALRASSSLSRPLSLAKSAFSFRLARFRLLNLHFLFASAASAC